MRWNSILNDLRVALSDLIDTNQRIRQTLEVAQFPSDKINFERGHGEIWQSVLLEADKAKKVEDIIQVVLGDYPKDDALKGASEAYIKKISESPPPPEEDSRKHFCLGSGASGDSKSTFQAQFWPFQKILSSYQRIVKKVFRESSEPESRLPDVKPDYAEISDLFREGLVIPFLGYDIVGTTSIPSVDAIEKEFVIEPPLERDLARKMADNGSFLEETQRNPLPVISQRFKTDVSKGSRTRFYRQLKELFPQNISPGPVHEFLVKQEKPTVVVTTCYDTLLEKMFRKQGKPFAVVTHVAYTTNSEDLGKVVVQYSDRQEAEKPICSDELEIDLENCWVFYKIRGSFDLFTKGPGGKKEIDSIIISEEDYFAFMNRLKTQERTIPNILVPLFWDRTFLFLGYWMTNWNFRTIVHFLYKKARSPEVASYAVHEVIQNDPAFERWFWENDDVRFIDMGVSDFIYELAKEMGLNIQ